MTAQLERKVSAFYSTGPLLFHDLDADGICNIQPGESYDTLQSVYSITTHLVLTFGGPFLILVVANIIFIQSLRSRKRSEISRNATSTISAVVSSDPTRINRLNRKLRQERNYVIILLVLTCSFSFFLLIAIGTNFLGRDIFAADPTTQDKAQFFQSLSAVALIMNNSLNFAFYLLCGRMYRSACKKALLKLCNLSG